MKTTNVIILSGACCNPSFAFVDEKIQTRITKLAEKNGLQVSVSIVTISTAAFGGVAGVSKETDEFIRSLITDKGMSVLPVVIFDDNVAFYGGLASSDLIGEKLRECIND